MNSELMERAQREDREWREAHIHFAVHGTWDDKSDCLVCQGVIYPDSPYLKLTPMARDRLSVADYEQIVLRARRLNARVGALYSARNRGWACTAETPGKRVELRASGPLAAVLAGLLDDLEAA